MLSDKPMSKRKAIPRLIRAATAGAIGLAAAGALAAFASPAQRRRPPGHRRRGASNRLCPN